VVPVDWDVEWVPEDAKREDVDEDEEEVEVVEGKAMWLVRIMNAVIAKPGVEEVSERRAAGFGYCATWYTGGA